LGASNQAPERDAVMKKKAKAVLARTAGELAEVIEQMESKLR